MRIFHCLVASAVLLSYAQFSDAQETEAIPTAKPVADSAGKEPTPAKPIAKSTAAIRPLSVTVELVDGKTKLVGTLTDQNTLEMKTSFGAVNVPLSEVAGFRFPSVDDATTTLVMLNGDSITGATDVQELTVETEWGTAQINGQSIQSILFVPNLTWSSSTGLNGKRWALTEPQSNIAQPPARSNSASPNAPVRSAPTRTIQNAPSFPSGFGN